MKKSHRKIDKKKKIIRDYNKTASFYDRRYRELQEEKYEFLLKNYRANGKNILDLGCGTGLFFEYIRKSILDNQEIKCNYTAIDISWNMLLEFQSKFIISECLKRTPNLLLSDIEYLPFRDNVFSSIFSITSFQNLPQLEKGINELFRVSKSNADFRFSTLKKNLNLKSLFKILNTKITSLKTIENEDLEDIVLEGRYFKY